MNNFSKKDVEYMRSALALARRGLGRVWPNPSVGCLIVKNGIVLARARTADTGRPHAEYRAIAQAGENCTGADMYVTLEPCANHGKTPPCCELIASSGISRVVVACTDPDQRTNGSGIEQMQLSGLDVVKDVCPDTARSVNAGYFLSRMEGRPMFTLKTASTIDAKIATENGESKWITGDLSRRRVHMERDSHDAILTGIDTVIADDPELTSRLAGVHHRSVRIVLDSHLRLPLQSCILKSSQEVPTWIFTTVPENDKRFRSLLNLPVEIFSVRQDKYGHCDLYEVAMILGRRGLTRVLVEAGGRLAAAFLRQRLCDRLLWFRSQGIIGMEGISAIGPLKTEKLSDIIRGRRTEIISCGEDCLEIYEFSS